jgi:hypothetical protein
MHGPLRLRGIATGAVHPVVAKRSTRSSDASCQIYQHSETNVMHFLFSLLRIKSLYTFRTYLLILRERCTSGTLYIACVLCFAATKTFFQVILR